MRIGAVLLLLVFLSASARAGEIRPADAEVQAALKQVAGERWYGVYFFTNKIGWAHEKVELTKDRVLSTWDAYFKISMLGVSVVTRLENKSTYSRTGSYALLEAQGTLQDMDRKQTVSGKVEGGKFVVTQLSNGKQGGVTWPHPAGTALELVPWAAFRRMKADDFVKYDVPDLNALERSSQTVKYLGPRKAGGARANTVVHEFSTTDDRGITLSSLVTDDGLVLQAGFGPSLTVKLEDREQATKAEKGTLDLFLASRITVDKALDETRLSQLQRADYEVELPAGASLQSDGRQTVSMKGTRGVVIVDARAPFDAAKEQPEPWLSCDAGLGCKTPELEKTAREVAGKATGLAAAKLLSVWVNAHLRYDLGVSLRRADQILAEGRGDCLEYATLLVALCRNAGIPARVVSGIAYAGSNPPGFAYHAWAEVLENGRWVALDPTWNEFPVDASHIKLDIEGRYSSVQLLGAIKLKINEVVYALDEPQAPGEGKQPSHASSPGAPRSSSSSSSR